MQPALTDGLLFFDGPASYAFTHRAELMKLNFVLGTVLSTCMFIGCGDGTESFNRVAVSGTVTLSGDSAVSGSMIATANIENGLKNTKDRPNVQTLITDGKFEFTAENGPAPGDYFVEVSIDVEGSVETGPEGEDETESATYKASITIPEGGSDSLEIKLRKGSAGGDSESGEV